ncbi:MAG: GNAT superfamily N-acetyltransferase [Devosia sp.]
MFTLAPVAPDAAGFSRLLAESKAGGHLMLVHFQENWRSGANVFARPGEIMLGAWDGDTLVGTCGRNVDPYDPHLRAGRVRYLYVAEDHRKQGIGQRLIAAIQHDAARNFDYLNTNAPEAAFAFYVHLGFEKLTEEYATHRYVLTPH